METQWQVRLMVGKKFGPNWRSDTFSSRQEAEELYNTLLDQTVRDHGILMAPEDENNWKYRIGSTDYYVSSAETDEEQSFFVKKVVRGWFFDESTDVFILTLTKMDVSRLVTGDVSNQIDQVFID